MTSPTQPRIRAARSVTALTALASGLIGILANCYLVLFYLTAKPWQRGSVDGSYGAINDWLIPLQLALLIPIVIWLGQQAELADNAHVLRRAPTLSGGSQVGNSFLNALS
jgi:hypothetical protein